MHHKSIINSALFTCALSLVCQAQTPVPLFNGRDLSGWVQRGGKATYAIEGNEIVGTSVLDTGNTFLCTAQNYGDFILEYEFKVDPKLNSGVQIRSEVFDEAKTVEWQGRTIQIPAKRVHGYQIEIDPDVKRQRMWSAGIFDEARRAWLVPDDGQTGPNGRAFSERGRKIFKPNDWNHVRVEAVGDSISTWLNGTPCAELKDSMTSHGFIALQVHGIGKDVEKNGTQVRWRNLTITEVKAPAKSAANTLTPEEIAAGWRLLWDGQTTTGWRSAKGEEFPAHGWLIQDGQLNVLDSGGKEAVGGGDIITRETFTEFELLVDFKLTPGANSGIKYFVQPGLAAITATGAKAAVGSAIGLEFQILDDALHPDAKLGRDGNRTVSSLYDLIPASASKQPNAIGEWNTARVLVRGNHVEHWLNDTKVVEYERDSPAFRAAVAASKYKNIPGFGEWPSGHILLQEHGDAVSFRNVKVRAIVGP
ncbi:DUF1080 domain-containing protein [Oleiharenicola lentus]|uniref:DUF1080 domain-containing protein n=1 Tax=Oleiharenicola lentus TaxID=2508720 RepID=A0A4Q1CAQ7_9BACT|nr:DUF1080 domain-containing protein [Oleiharenicola lentus]RXK55952.1 DUF1080 domain-containing protein [Oleiharenicola lentus]